MIVWLDEWTGQIFVNEQLQGLFCALQNPVDWFGEEHPWSRYTYLEYLSPKEG